MRKSNVAAALLSAAALIAPAPAAAKKEAVTLDYRLPAAKIGFAVSHMITACPGTDGTGFAMNTVTAIKPVYAPGETILIDPEGKWTIDREVKLEFHDNGTLKSFNGSSKGQGGKLVAAAIKAASVAVTTAMGVPPVAMGIASLSRIQCEDRIVELLQEKQDLQGVLASLRRQVASGGPSDSLLAQITRHEAALADVLKDLTISSKAVIWTPSADIRNLPQSPAPADLSAWFKPVPLDELEQALHDVGLGQMRDFRASASFATAPDPASTANDGKPYSALVYREPALVEVTLAPREDFSPGKLDRDEARLARADYDATKAKATIKVPQIGKLRVIRFDGSSIFGSRAVAASFEKTGELTAIGYTSTGGADALAGVVDAGTAAFIELRDQETAALKREVERRTQANALEALLEAEAEAD